MGWTYEHRESGKSDREFFQEKFRDDLEILDSFSRSGECYLAIREGDEVRAAVALYQRVPNDYYNYGWKLMDEECGPCAYRCPAKILFLLTPTESERANAWREACWKEAERKAAIPNVKKGETVRFASPITFTSGITRDTFTFEGRTSFRTEYGENVKISRWKDRKFEVVA